MFKDIYWMSALTMEEVFIVTGMAVVIIGIVFGLTLYLFDEKSADEEKE